MASGLEAAVAGCRFKHLRYLLNSGLSVNICGAQDGSSLLVTALHIQDSSHRTKMLQLLIKHGVDCHLIDPITKRCPFLWACSIPGRSHDAHLILDEVGYDVDYMRRDASGMTALHYAIVHADANLTRTVCQQMVKVGLSADLMRDDQGLTPYLLAVKLGRDECAAILADEGQASCLHVDLAVYQMPRHWALVREKLQAERKRQDSFNKMTTYKILGRLPQLKKANFQIDRVKIVESRQDLSMLLNSSRSEELNDKITHQRAPLANIGTAVGRNEVKSSSRKTRSHSLPNITITSADGYGSSSFVAAMAHNITPLPAIAEERPLLVRYDPPPNSPPIAKTNRKYLIDPPVEAAWENTPVSYKKRRRCSEADALQQKTNIANLLQMGADKHVHNFHYRKPVKLPPRSANISPTKGRKASKSRLDKRSIESRETVKDTETEVPLTKEPTEKSQHRSNMGYRKPHVMVVSKDNTQKRSLPAGTAARGE